MKQYPYIARLKSDDIKMALFTGPKTATALTDNFADIKLGESDSEWDESFYKNITHEYLSNTWGVVESKEHAEFIIELAENAGFELVKNGSKYNKYFALDGFNLVFLGLESIAKGGCKQITIPLPPKAKAEKPDLSDLPKHFDCRCNKCGGKCCSGFCDPNNEPCKINTFAGVATIGEGKHKSRYGGNKTKAYKVWEGMITRCYVKGSAHYSRYGGRGVTVCDEWLNYQNFANWYFDQKNNYKEGFQIDKDLKVSGCKIYSPSTCEIIPSRVNSLLISTNSVRGNLPVGVHSLKNKFKASCRDELGSKVHLGTFANQSEAFSAYKNFKKGVVVTVANNEFDKGNISKRIYENLIRMEIHPFPE